MTDAGFAIPGALSTPTGGYAYARRLFRQAPMQDLRLMPVALPGSFPLPTALHLGMTEQLLHDQPESRALLIDGLAYGALPTTIIDQIVAPIVALCHHPLALESGLTHDLAMHLRRTERAALARASRVITTSHATAKILEKDYAVTPELITVAPPGTDQAPRAIGSGSRACHILAVGSLTKRKGHDVLISALSRLSKLEWTLKIVGPETDTAYAAELRKQIDVAGLTARVQITGPLSLPQLTAAYQSADLFALASSYEGFGMAFTEAMSHGLPVVGLTSSAVEEATAGAARLVHAMDLRATLTEMITDREARTQLADQCWTAAQTLMRWPQTTAIVKSVLQEASL